MMEVSKAPDPATKLEQNAYAQTLRTSDVTGGLRGNITGETTKWNPGNLTMVERFKTPETEREIFKGARSASVPIRRAHSETVGARLDYEAESIMRIHFASEMLSDLKQVQQHCHTPRAAMYVDSLFSTVRLMRDVSPYDPYMALVMALYDALAYRNSWADYKRDQYKEAYRILKQMADVKHLNKDRIDKAIMRLEAAGFDTTPFAIDVGDDEDDQSDGA